MVVPEGMFRRHSLDITENLLPSGENKLAVLVHPPNHPGSIPPEGGQGGDHEVYLLSSMGSSGSHSSYCLSNNFN